MQHSFSSKKLEIPTICSVCNNLIYGAGGMVCDCGESVHTHCERASGYRCSLKSNADVSVIFY
jgi:hypothetical protein